jgi:biopolymer transport protein TolR
MAAASNNGDDIISSINITPLVDIFLVLLIIFMITSSVLSQKEIPVNLPKAAHAGDDAPEASGLVIDHSRAMFLDGQPIDSISLAALLGKSLAKDPVHMVLISADEDLPYKEIIRVIDLIRGIGVSKYALKVVRQEN